LLKISFLFRKKKKKKKEKKKEAGYVLIENKGQDEILARLN